MGKDYTSEDIEVLTDIEHVRRRTQIYLGSMNETEYDIPVFGDDLGVENIKFIPAVLKAFGEIVDNSIDEFAQVKSKRHKLVIDGNPGIGKYSVSDNGRGIPIDKHPSGKYTPELALSSMRAGRNFSDNKTSGTIGQNGVGSSCVNFVSSEFLVKVNRDEKEYTQVFSEGCSIIGVPIIQKGSKRTGTSVSFKLDSSVFNDVRLPEVLIREKCRALAFTNPGLSVEYNSEEFKYKSGLDDILSGMDLEYYRMFDDDDGNSYEFFLIFDYGKSEHGDMFTWLNSSLLGDGGSCNTQFVNALADKTIRYLEKEAKKQKCKVTRNDVRVNLMILGNIKVSDPEFDSQAKTRLVGPSLRSNFDDLFDKHWGKFVRDNESWFESVLANAHRRHHTSANIRAINAHNKLTRKRVKGFKDATSKNRKECMIFISEGISASSEIQNVRDPSIHASFPLTGKINNVYNSTPAQVLQMGKITNMLTVLGLSPGTVATMGNINFGKIILAVDSDPDGNHIAALLVNILYKFWPELFKFGEPVVYKLIAPNIVATNKHERVYFPSMVEFGEVSKEYKNYDIEYFKGLGSMATGDWRVLLRELDDYLVPYEYDENFGDVIDLIFSSDVGPRKEWLMSEVDE